MLRVKGSYHVYAIITILFWSLAYVFTRLALRHFSAFSLGFLRYAVASSVLLAVNVATRMERPQAADAKWFILGGATGFFIYMLTFNTGSVTANASTCSVVIATAPVMTAFSARLFYKERLKLHQWLGIWFSFSGVVILTALSGGLKSDPGIKWLIGATISVSFYNLIQRRLTRKYTALQTASYCIFAGTAMLAVFAPQAVAELKTAPPAQFFNIAMLGLFCSAAAYLSWSQALAMAPRTSAVTNYMFITPFLTTFFALIITREMPELSTITGGVVIIGGLLLFNYGNCKNK